MSDEQSMKASNHLLDLMFDTPSGKIKELTYLPKGTPVVLARQMAMHHLFDGSVHERDEEGNVVRYVPIDELAVQYYLQLQRSVDGNHIKRGIELASMFLANEEEMESYSQ